MKRSYLSFMDVDYSIKKPNGAELHVIDNLSFNLTFEDSNKIVCLLSPYGSGKSTLLKLCAGKISPIKGKVEIYDAGKDRKSVSKSFIPSNLPSFFWRTVKQNISMNLKDEVSKSEKENKIKYLIELVGLNSYEDFYPRGNSHTNFNFRVVMARALAYEPFIIFIDEPFEKMKLEAKEESYSLLKEINRKTSSIYFFSTSNINEAINLADIILISKNSPLNQLQIIKFEETETEQNKLIAINSIINDKKINFRK